MAGSGGPRARPRPGLQPQPQTSQTPPRGAKRVGTVLKKVILALTLTLILTPTLTLTLTPNP